MGIACSETLFDVLLEKFHLAGCFKNIHNRVDGTDIYFIYIIKIVLVICQNENCEKTIYAYIIKLIKCKTGEEI